jgi:hypothetical protein
MNASFLLLILTLFGLAFLTSWNKHVIFMMFCSTLLWGAMIWYSLFTKAVGYAELDNRFVVEITRTQLRPDNLPVEPEKEEGGETKIRDTVLSAVGTVEEQEGKKDR